MTFLCPQGHQSGTSDFCDVCGEPIEAAAATTPSEDVPAAAPASSLTLDPPAGAPAQQCPNCGSENPADALFCEACGFDFCDVCGEPIEAAVAATTPSEAVPAAAPPASSLTLDPPAGAPAPQCPNCGSENPADALFCEACGFDFTTGQLPAAAAPMPDPGADWVAEVWIDPDWFAFQNSPGGCATSGAPTVIPLRGTTALIGRLSKSRNLVPEIECANDGAVSHRHAQLTLDHDRWYVEDLGSTNGTFVGAPGDPLPTTPLEPQQRHELADDERVYVGAWTRVMVRRSTDDERATATG